MRSLLLFIFLLFSLSVWSQNGRKGMDRALFFAVNDYERMTDLSNPIQNASDIAAELERRYGFETEVVPNPKFEAIERKIADYKRQYSSGRYDKQGQLLIFFTGHGVKKGSNGYFMPADADPDRPYTLGIEYDYWRNEINDIDCKHILVAIDACHSITFDPNWENKPDRDFKRPGERFNDQVLLNHKNYRARLFFTSDAKGNQTPDRSTFAEQFLAGLRTHRSSTRYLTSSELFASYMKKAAPTPGGGTFGSNDAGSAFLFFQQVSSPGVSSARSDQAAWRSAQQTNSIAAYQQYLAQYPQGDFVPVARQKLQQLQSEEQELLDWQATKRTNTALAYRSFIQQYPQSVYKDVAAIRLKELAPTPKTELDNMVFIQGGTFQMGSKDGKSNETPHSVTLSDYYIARHEVTFEEYDRFCQATGKTKPDDEGWGRGKRPVINVSWYDAIEYCNWRSSQDGLTPVYSINERTQDPNNKSSRDDLKWTVTINWQANGYRLPTEAEWEYAARSRGKDQKWAGTSSEDQLTSFANGYGKTDGYQYTSPVGTFKANDLGLFDMNGNVYEWCWDWYGSYSLNSNSNPKGPNTGSGRVLRGGSWFSLPASLRCAYRLDLYPDDRNLDIGFRLSRAAP